VSRTHRAGSTSYDQSGARSRPSGPRKVVILAEISVLCRFLTARTPDHARRRTQRDRLGPLESLRTCARSARRCMRSLAPSDPHSSEKSHPVRKSALSELGLGTSASDSLQTLRIPQRDRVPEIPSPARRSYPLTRSSARDCPKVSSAVRLTITKSMVKF